jgi:hypothetical protein
MIYAKNLSPQIAIGAMDRKIQIKRKLTETLNDLDEVVSATYSTLNVMAAMVENDKDETEVLSKQTVSKMKTFIFRYTTLTYEDLIVYETKEYDIINIDETMGRKRFLKVKVKLVE